MKNIIGIRRETKDHTQRRSPLSPDQVKQLIQHHGIRVIVQPWENRVFSNSSFVEVGAEVSEELSSCNIIFGVKEIAPDLLLDNMSYCFFSHTVKGQLYNMPILRAMLEKGDSLFDYELVKGSDGKRLIFFGDYAGYAGMIDTLWALGRRLQWEGLRTPFEDIQYATSYERLNEAKDEIRKVGGYIKQDGLPDSLVPFVTAFTGYGHVSTSAQRLYDFLPSEELLPDQLEHFFSNGDFSNKKVYKVVFKKPDLYRMKSGGGFNIDDFISNPQLFESKFERYLQYCTIVINGIYWEPRFPRLITKAFMKELFTANECNRLRIIGDITCDIDGSNELTVKETNVENPVYVFDPVTGKTQDGWEGRGPVVLAVDKLPTELPLEASEEFGNGLLPFVSQLAAANYNVPLDMLTLPKEFRSAMILHRGKLTPEFSYLNNYL